MKHFQERQIFYLFPERDAFIDKWQRIHFIDELKNYGISFYCYNSILKKQDEYEAEVLSLLKNNSNGYSLFMTAMNDEEMSCDFLNKISAIGIPTLLVCWDNLVIPFYHRKNAPLFDLVWLTSFETDNLFKKWGANTIFLPYASNPFTFKPNSIDSIKKLLFIGSPHGGRKRVIEFLSEKDIPLQVFGQWKRNENIKSTSSEQVKKKLRKFNNYIRFEEGRKCLRSTIVHSAQKRLNKESGKFNLNKPNLSIEGPLSFDDMVKAYSNYTLSFSIIEYLDTFLLKKPLYKLHLRTFEIPMCGGLQITKRIPEINQYFKDGHDIVLYDSEDELIDKTRFYLKDENTEVVKKMKVKARKNCENNHSWKKRFEAIYEVLYK